MSTDKDKVYNVIFMASYLDAYLGLPFLSSKLNTNLFTKLSLSETTLNAGFSLV